MKVFNLFIILLIVNSASAQNKFTNIILADCVKMMTAIKNKDYEVIVNYTYPKFVEMTGSKKKLIELTKKSYAEMEQNNFFLEDFIFEKPSKIYTAGSELHCTIGKTTIVKTPNGRVSQLHYMLVVSKNQGKSWYYIETHALTERTIKQIFPKFNYNLKIPKKSALKYL